VILAFSELIARSALIVTNLRAEPHRLARDTDPELVNPLGLLRFD
jgi:hypothetical protein